MITRILRCGVLSFAFFLFPVVASADAARIEYSESLQQFELERGALVEGMNFNAFGKHFDVRLAPNQNILSAAVRERLSSDVGVFRGTVEGMPGSWVRIVVADDIPRGLIWDGASMYAIEASKSGSAAPFIFRLEDLQLPADSMTCLQKDGEQTAGDLLKTVTNEVTPSIAQAASAESIIDVAVIADFEFATNKGSAAEAELVTRMNNVDGIFSEQLGVQINLARTDIFTSSNDPFTDESDAGSLLDELADYRSSTPAQRANGLSHLFTGREFDTSTVGVAYVSAICSTGFGVGLTQGTHSATTDSLIAAHEIGHNFGAPHDGTGGACSGTSQDFLMAPRLNGSDTFSSCSISQMQDDVNRASCIRAVPTLDVAVVANQASSSLLGNSQTVSFVVNSVGTEDATGVEFEVTVPSSVNLDSVSSTIGSCSNGGGNATCSIGSIGAGSSATVDLTVTSTSPGQASFSATVTTTGDTNGGNDQATLNLTVDPAVDLVASAAASSVNIDESATARVTVENDASIAATSASVTITASSGIRLDSASWSVGSCSVSGSVATCDASSLAAQSNNTIDVRITGLTLGTESLSVNVSASEADRVSGNNSAQGQVTVNEAPDSGGGAFDLFLLFGILVVVLLDRQRSIAG